MDTSQKLGTPLHRFERRHDGSWQHTTATIVRTPKGKSGCWIKIHYSGDPQTVQLGTVEDGLGWNHSLMAAYLHAQENLLTEYKVGLERLRACLDSSDLEGVI